MAHSNNNNLPQFLGKMQPLEIKVAQELEQLNEIYAPFKLSDEDLARWAVRITTVKPDVTPEQVGAVVLNFIIGKYQWNKNFGVANMFHGLIKLANRGMVY